MEVNLHNNTLEQYDSLLSKFSNWIVYKRDIKLNTLLESGKRIEFKVEIETHKYGAILIELDNLDKNSIFLNDVCANVEVMTFIINSNKIDKLELEFSILNTEKGAIVEPLLNNDDIKMKLENKLDRLNNVVAFKLVP